MDGMGVEGPGFELDGPLVSNEAQLQQVVLKPAQGTLLRKYAEKKGLTVPEAVVAIIGKELTRWRKEGK